MKKILIALLVIGILCAGVYIVYNQTSLSAVLVPNTTLTVQTKAEPNEVRSGEKSTISWSSVGATGCYLSSPSEKRNEIGVSGSSSSSIYSKFLPIKITCYDEKGNEASEDLVLVISVN